MTVAAFDVWHYVDYAPALLASVATLAEARKLFNGRVAAVIVSGGVVLDARAPRERAERELIAAAVAASTPTTPAPTTPTPTKPDARPTPSTRPAPTRTAPAPYLSSKPGPAPSITSRTPTVAAIVGAPALDLRACVANLSAELSAAIARAEESEAGDSRHLATLLAIAEELGLSEGAGSDEILDAVRRVLRKARRADTDRKLQVARARQPRESAPAFAPLLPAAFYDALRGFGAR